MNSSAPSSYPTATATPFPNSINSNNTYSRSMSMTSPTAENYEGSPASNSMMTTSSYPHSQSMIVAPTDEERTMVLRRQSAPPIHIRNETDAAKKKRRRTRRRLRMAAGGASGLVVGGLVGGPVGAVIGVGVGAVATRQVSKQGEKRKDNRVARHNLSVSGQSANAPIARGVSA
jgi:hypothetical protein